ncbi:MAG: hypothetical protein ACLUE8_14470 [Lachnospiraceae bacterium]
MKDWDSLFGDVPESFSRRVHDTVDRLERQESAPARPSGCGPWPCWRWRSVCWLERRRP